MQDTSDVEFVVEGKSIHAHKTILVLRCEHFKTMFTGDYKESTAKLVTVIMHAMKLVQSLIQSGYNLLGMFIIVLDLVNYSIYQLQCVWFCKNHMIVFIIVKCERKRNLPAL